MEQKIIAENGVNIYSYPNEHLHSFCISLYVKAGCMYEEEWQNGVTHFLEHVVIRNINYIRNGELYRQLDKLGLIFSACTYKEFVQFELSGARKHFNEAARIISQLFEPIVLPATEIAIERKRIKAEIRESDEKRTLSFFTNQLIWEGTTLAQPILGSNKWLDKMGKATLAQTHRNSFCPENIFFYVTGGFIGENLQYLKQCVDGYILASGFEERQNLAPVPTTFFNRNGSVELKNGTDSIVQLSFDVDMTTHAMAEYMLLFDILFGCENAKVHQELSEKSGYIYSFEPQFEQYNNIGNLYVQYEVQPARLTDSVRMVIDLLHQMKKGISEELEYVKATYIDNGEIILDHASDFNWTRAYEAHILKRDYPDIQARQQEYAEVKPKDITKLAREIFVPDNTLVTVKGRKSKKIQEEIRQIVMGL